MVYLPYILARDNTGFVIIDVKNKKTLKLSSDKITANLFGHGDVLQVCKTAMNKVRVLSVMQTPTQALVTACEMPTDMTLALKGLLK